MPRPSREAAGAGDGGGTSGSSRRCSQHVFSISLSVGGATELPGRWEGRGRSSLGLQGERGLAISGKLSVPTLLRLLSDVSREKEPREAVSPLLSEKPVLVRDEDTPNTDGRQCDVEAELPGTPFCGWQLLLWLLLPAFEFSARLGLPRTEVQNAKEGAAVPTVGPTVSPATGQLRKCMSSNLPFDMSCGSSVLGDTPSSGRLPKVRVRARILGVAVRPEEAREPAPLAASATAQGQVPNPLLLLGWPQESSIVLESSPAT